MTPFSLKFSCQFNARKRCNARFFLALRPAKSIWNENQQNQFGTKTSKINLRLIFVPNFVFGVKINHIKINNLA